MKSIGKPKIDFLSKVFLLITAVILSINYLSTPLLVRSLVDGILPSKDINGISIFCSFIIVNEFIGLVSNWSFNRCLNNILIKAIEYIKSNLFQIICRNPSQTNLENLTKIWEKEIFSFCNFEYKRIWLLKRDFITLTLLALTAAYIHYTAGLMILSVSILIVGLTWVLKKNDQSEYVDFGRLDHAEKECVRDLYHKSKMYFKLGRDEQASEELWPYLGALNETRFKTLKNLEIKDFLKRSIRTLMVISIILVSYFNLNDPNWSSGTVWALLILMYRVTGPLQNVLGLFFQSDRKSDSISNWIHEVFSNNSILTPQNNELVSTLRNLADCKENSLFLLTEPSTLKTLTDTLCHLRGDSGEILALDIDKLRYLDVSTLDGAGRHMVLFSTARYCRAHDINLNLSKFDSVSFINILPGSMNLNRLFIQVEGELLGEKLDHLFEKNNNFFLNAWKSINRSFSSHYLKIKQLSEASPADFGCAIVSFEIDNFNKVSLLNMNPNLLILPHPLGSSLIFYKTEADLNKICEGSDLKNINILNNLNYSSDTGFVWTSIEEFLNHLLKIPLKKD